MSERKPICMFPFMKLFFTMVFFVMFGAWIEHRISLSVENHLNMPPQTLHDQGWITMKSDCDLLLYRTSDHRTLWSSKAQGKDKGCTVSMKSDGSLSIQFNEKNTLGAKETFSDNQVLTSTNGFYSLRMQSDCNLVLYRNSNLKALWSSKTENKAKDCAATMQSDGNLVIVDNKNNVLWSTYTFRKEDEYQLVMHDDGNAVIYTGKHVPIWSTHTAG